MSQAQNGFKGLELLCMVVLTRDSRIGCGGERYNVNVMGMELE